MAEACPKVSQFATKRVNLGSKIVSVAHSRKSA
jgi:hypothetical protein